jgi:hypothetical protein
MDRLTLDAAGASWPSWERQKKSPASSFICSPPLQVLVSRLTGHVPYQDLICPVSAFIRTYARLESDHTSAP